MKLTELNQEDLVKNIEKTLSLLTDFLGIELQYKYEITAYTAGTGEERELLSLILKGEENGPLLIGYHGRTLENLQHLISLSLSNEYKQTIRIQLDINDYRQKKIENLENLARRAAQQVIESGQELELQPMPAADRRIVHQVITSEGKLRTESIGEDYERRIIVKPI